MTITLVADTAPPITIDDVRGMKLRQSQHLNGGSDWFAYRYVCIEQPRLSRFDRYDKRKRSVEVTWEVDGAEVENLAAAVDRLNVPPVLDAVEIVALALIPADWTPVREARQGMALETFLALRSKGCIEAEDAKCRLTDLGRRFLTEGR